MTVLDLQALAAQPEESAGRQSTISLTICNPGSVLSLIIC
jgi:hypothetical protein